MHRALIISCIALTGCVQSAAPEEGDLAGALESLGEYEVGDYNTCGPHWDGVYALSANRIAELGAGTDQLFFEPTDPTSPAERGRGSLSTGTAGVGTTFSLDIRFKVDGESIFYDCGGSLDSRSILMSCESADGVCSLALSSAAD